MFEHRLRLDVIVLVFGLVLSNSDKVLFGVHFLERNNDIGIHPPACLVPCPREISIYLADTQCSLPFPVQVSLLNITIQMLYLFAGIFLHAEENVCH